jgi:HK97 family phage major capsid protein
MEEIQDSPISILSWVQTKLTEMAGRAIDLQALEGTGSPFTGLSNATGVVDAVVGANGDLVTYASLVALAFAARERASREGAKFFVSPEIMGKIVGLVDNNGQPIVQFGNVPNAFAAAVIGFPVEVHSAIRADRTYGTGTGGSNVYFGPPRQIVIGDRQGMAWDVSDIPGFSTAEVHMRLIARLGLGVAVPKSFARHLQMKAV